MNISYVHIHNIYSIFICMCHSILSVIWNLLVDIMYLCDLCPPTKQTVPHHMTLPFHRSCVPSCESNHAPECAPANQRK